MVYSIAKDGAVHIYLYDYKGSTTAIVDNSGTVLNAYTYSAYGKVVGSFENVENAYKYLGKYGEVGWTFSDVGHLILDGAGLVPVVGEAFDGVNGIMRYPLL